MQGICFDKIHSFYDLNLVLSSVDIPPATPKTNYVEIPGGDGSVDLTEALGEVRYKDRECKFVFTVFPSDDFEVKKTEISNLLNGRRFKITVDKNPDYYWIGRCAVNDYASSKNLHQITVGATVSPYKLKNNLTTIIITAGENVAATLPNSRKTAIPTITCTAETTIIFNGNEYALSAGTHKILNVELVAGENQIAVTSAEPVTFVYQEGDL